MKRRRASALAVALLALALALLGGGSALADFPYSPGSGTDLHDYSTFHTNAGQVPNDLSGDGNDWKFAATPANPDNAQAPVTPAQVAATNARPSEQCGVRGGSVADKATTQPGYTSTLAPSPPSCAGTGPVKTAWSITTGRPDVAIAVLDSGIKWFDQGNMTDLRAKVRINTGELPYPQVSDTRLEGVDPGVPVNTCAGYTHGGYDPNGDGVVNVKDYACDPRVVNVVLGDGSPGSTPDPRRHGPAHFLTPEDLILAFGNCQIDSGTHTVSQCVAGKHFDNDGNGFSNDIAGWNFLDDNNNPYDDVHYGHGTGEALDSSAEANNANGQAGGCPNCMVVPLRVGDSFVADASRFAQATTYAVDNNVLVVQEALGTINNTQLARQAVDYAYRHGVAVIASAADEAAQHHNYVSSLPHTIVVNSVNQYETVTPQPPSFLAFNGCTNFSSKVTLAIPSSSCSSNATGVGAGIAGLIYSAALNARDNGVLAPNSSCVRPDGHHCVITANEVRQLMASGSVGGTKGVVGAADSSTPQADDVNFASGDNPSSTPEPSCSPSPAPGCTDPNGPLQTQVSGFRPVVSALANTRSYPARYGFDQFYGYGRVNAWRGARRAADGEIPPEVEITSPDWFTQVDPAQPNMSLQGHVFARGTQFVCRVYVAPGSYPNNYLTGDPTPGPGDFKDVSAQASPGLCDGHTPHNDAIDGHLASLDLADLKSRFPTDASQNATLGGPAFGGRETGLTGLQTANGRPNTEPYGFTVRVVAWSTFSPPGGGGPDIVSGQDRRNFFLHRDQDMKAGFPRQLPSDGESSPAFADLTGDNRNDLIFATADGLVHAQRPDGSELPGFPVHTDPLPLHTGGQGFSSGEVSPTASYGSIVSSVAVGDLNHTGQLDVVAADYQGKIYAWDGHGHLLWKQEANPAYGGAPIQDETSVRQGELNRVGHGFLASPVLAHLDGNPNGPLDVVAASMDRHVYAFGPDGSPLAGYPVLVIDKTKVQSVDPTTHQVTFKSSSGAVQQGPIVDTPAIGDIDASGKPEIIVGTNEEYDISHDGGLNASLTSPTLTALSTASALPGVPGLANANSRIYALRASGEPAGGSPGDGQAVLPNWPVRIGLLEQHLLPVVGEGITGSPVIGPVTCPNGGAGNKVGVIPDGGPGYVLNPDGTSCQGPNDPSNHNHVLATDTPSPSSDPNGPGHDTPAFPAVGHPAFGNFTGGVTFLSPATGLNRALDVAFNEYQFGGQDFVGAWDPASGQFRYTSRVNDLQFLTGPSVGDITGSGQESVVAGTASDDLQALDQTGAPVSTNWPKLTGDWTIANPLLGSFGTLDTSASAHRVVVSMTRSGVLSVYDTPAGACAPASWPKFHHDLWNSGNYSTDATDPGVPMNAAVSAGKLTFTAPGNDLLCGTASRYDVRTSDSPITPENFAAAPAITGAPAPQTAGSAESITLPATARRYVAVRAVDGQGNVGLPAVVDTGPRPSGTGATGATGPTGTTGPPLNSPFGNLGSHNPPGQLPGPPGLGLPGTAGCTSHRRLLIHLVAPAGQRIVSARVLLNGRRVRVLRGRRLHAPINLRGLPRGRFTVTIVARTNHGKTLRSKRRYRTCTRGRGRRHRRRAAHRRPVARRRRH